MNTRNALRKLEWMIAGGALVLAAGWAVFAAEIKFDAKDVVTGPAVFKDYTSIKTGAFRKITVADLPKPFATPSARGFAKIVARPADAWPQAPSGFKVDLYVTGLDNPRKILTAPNGDFFVAESEAGDVKVFRGRDKQGKPEQASVFASGLRRPYGIAFYPAGPNPQWVYVGNTNSVVRFPYKNGDLKASGAPQTLVNNLPPDGNHWTRDLVFSKDGQRLFVAVGSASNVDDPDTTPRESHRANILEFTPDGKFVKVYGAGIRNPAGINVNPTTGEVWCSVNERDELGDNLVPDYISSVKEGGFYGWPWFYMGSNQDPRLEGKHPELKGKVIVPDVLMPPHNASLAFTFYDGTQFPAEYRGDLFAGEHGSWNRAVRTGYEVVRVPLENGHASGVFQDFLTGFVTADGKVWGRPVGVAVAKDGALLVTDDGSQSIWRVSYVGTGK
jgi:glucose/arabinose dehydrogenase